jgi:hypothetical protein
VKLHDCIISKEYLKKYLEKKGANKLEKNVNMLLKFIRTFSPEFPTIESKECLYDVMKFISNFDYDKLEDNNIINNNLNNIGVNYLKSNFKSFWKSKYYKKISPIEAWYNDKILYKIIKYRIGLNNCGEVFDFSLHQILRGISAYRYTISFFKPFTAAVIYKKFLGEKSEPIVIDTCSGFGARMLAFKSLYPKGQYIGIEPNPETFTELIELSKNFDNVKLYNCKLEDYNGDKKCDLTFTSIPYYNKEIYSNNHEMMFEEWKNMVYNLINNYNNVLINISQE